MIKFIRIVTTIFILNLLLISCADVEKSLKFLRPLPWVFELVPKNAPPLYRKAWLQGCETGLASMSNDYYKTFYTFNQDTSLITNEIYYKTWKDTYTFCRHYVYAYLKDANLRLRPDDQRGLSSDSIFQIFELNNGTSGDGVIGGDPGPLLTPLGSFPTNF